MKHPLLRSKGNKPRTGHIVKCANCGKEIYLRPSSLRTHNYCSVKCHNEHQIKGRSLICKICGKEYYRSPAQIKWRGSSYCSNRCKGEAKGISQIGANSQNWKGGVSTENHSLRASKRWRIWREAVFARDNWTCQKCRDRCGKGNHISLHPHHIKSFADYPELRFNVSNGITLCEKCHKEEHHANKTLPS